MISITIDWDRRSASIWIGESSWHIFWNVQNVIEYSGELPF